MSRISLKFRLLEAAIRVVLPSAGIVLLVAGLMGLVSFAGMPLLEAVRCRQWIPVPAQLEKVEVLPPDFVRSRPLPALAVRYRYHYENADFTGERHDLHHGLDTAGEMLRRLEQLNDSPSVTAWVNPKTPEQSMLERSLHWTVVALALPAGVLTLLGAILVFAGMVAWNDWRPGWRQSGGK